MSFLSLLRLECGRLLQAKRTWVCALCAAVSPLLGFFLYRPIWSSSSQGYITSLNGTIIGNPAFAGALFGAIAFAILTAANLHDRQRYQIEALTDTVHSPFLMNLAQTVSLLFVAVLTQALTLLVFLPYSSIQLGSVFSFTLYMDLYLNLMLPALCFAVLFTASAYQLTRRFDISLALFAVFVLLSLTAWSEHWLLRWVNPAIAYLSDDFGNSRKIMSVCYNRLFWAMLLGGVWVLSFLGIRKYGKRLLGSIACNLRRIYIPAVAVVLMICACASYVLQPFIDHSPKLVDYDNYFNFEMDEDISCDGVHIDARPNLNTGSYHATAYYSIKNRAGEACTVFLSINPGYQIMSATANGKPVVFRDLKDDDFNQKHLELDLPPEKDIVLELEFGGFPKEWSIQELFQGDAEVSRDYIYLANQDFVPTLEVYTRDAFTMTGNISLPKQMTPVLYGTGTAKKLGENPDGTVRWLLENTNPSSIFYAGDYHTRQLHAAGIDLEFIYSRKHHRVMEENHIDDVIQNVFEYCTANIGPLTFGEGGTLKLIEIGSFGGGYAGDGASVMGEDSFNEQGLSDPLKGAGGAEVLAHEIIHQWWGLGNMFDFEDDSLWSSEGLTVYTTYRLMKELYGEEYARKNYIEVWQRNVDDYYQNFYIRNPEYFAMLPEAYQTDLQNHFTQMRQYCEMPLMLLKAEQLIGGEEAFDAILHEIFTREFDEEGTNIYLSYELFLQYCGLEKEDLTLA